MQPHALLLPYPETGHINPLMQLAKHLASQGILVTFVNTQYNHQRILQSNAGRLPADLGLSIRLLDIPDTLSDGENRDNDLYSFSQIILNIGPALENLIDKLTAGGERITCLISDALAVQTLVVAKKYGIPRVAFWPPSGSAYAFCSHYVRAATQGTLPRNGLLQPDEIVSFPELPSLQGWKLPWLIAEDQAINEYVFGSVIETMEVCAQSEWILGNCVHELEGSVIPSHFKRLTPIGPILPSSTLQRASAKDNLSTTSLWTEEDSCLQWLDAQKPKSVLYVSLGSIAIVDKDQFHELALALEAAKLAILWVVRDDLTGEKGTQLPEGFLERTQERMKIVSWSPQVLVLSHSAIGGFLTHCGWNSSMEALSMGIPLLLWPQFADQYINADTLAKWGVGLKMTDARRKPVGREIITAQVGKLMLEQEGEVVRARAMEVRHLMLKAVEEGGSSFNNLQAFVSWMKALPA
ncbi:hypothetical protein KP509_25G075000 [Ceratopteris richardii]|uniref:Glycosyltransferase n=2 Tax=Ceratopteris richardii TaxID=49495 RepID=A0A8T2RUH3_CERRI|nr:hypothetical protein KP509_25G075000 [Ceratopteris richardii]